MTMRRIGIILIDPDLSDINPDSDPDNSDLNPDNPNPYSDPNLCPDPISLFCLKNLILILILI